MGHDRGTVSIILDGCPPSGCLPRACRGSICCFRAAPIASPAASSRPGRHGDRRSRAHPAASTRSRRRSRVHGQSLASVTHLLLTHIHLDHAGRRRHDPAPPPRDPRRRARARRAPPGRSLEAARQRRRGCTATPWTACGARWRRCPSATWWSCRGGETIEAGGPIVRRGLHARPRLAPRLLLRSRRAASPSWATRPACAWTAATCCRRRRRPTSTWNGGSRASQTIERWRPSTLFLTHFGPVTTRAHAPPDAGRQPAAVGGAGARVAGAAGDRRRARRRAFEEAACWRELRRAHATRSVAPAYESAAGFRCRGPAWPATGERKS